jgi:hypothetical protein
MKKNPLSEIYESKVLTSEAVPSNKVKDAKSLENEMDLKKAKTVAGQGPEAAKKYVDAPKELHGTEVHEPKKLTTDSVEGKPAKAFEGSFEKLFKATITEQFPGEDTLGQEEMGVEETDVEVPTSNDDMVDELEGEKDEVSDLVSDLKSVMDHLQNILDKISEETGDEEESMEDDAEMEFGGEDEVNDIEDLETEEPVKEATELKPLGDKSKVFQNKNNKVGSVKPHGGKAHSGDIESDPELKPAKSFDKSLQSPKGKPEVKSTIKKGEFFK